MDEGTSFGINRARIKIGGHVYKPYFTYYFEQDIVGGNLLDFRAQIEKLPYLKIQGRAVESQIHQRKGYFIRKTTGLRQVNDQQGFYHRSPTGSFTVWKFKGKGRR